MNFPVIHRPRRGRRPLAHSGATSFAVVLVAVIVILLAAACSLNRALALPIFGETNFAETSFAQRSASPTQTIRRQSGQPVPPASAQNNPAGGASTATFLGTLVPATRLASVATPTQVVPSPTIASTATSTPGVLAASDLLFIGGDRLLRWDAITQFPTSLAENVGAFSPNSSGSKIALLRPRGVSANGNALFDLDILDFSSMQVTHLLEGAPRLSNLALSPDGDWLAFQQLQDSGLTVFLLSLRVISAASDPTLPLKLGQCQGLPGGGCTPFSWSADSQALLWGDSRGLWIAQVRNGAATLLHDNQVEIADPQGKTSQIAAFFSSPQWSPAGRFVLVEVIPDQSEASWHAVMDSLTGRIGQVLDSYKQLPGQVSVNWLPNGQLVVARSADLAKQAPAAFQVWTVLATNSSLLVSVVQNQFPTDIIPASLGGVADTGTKLVPPKSLAALELNWIQQANPGRLLFSAVLQAPGAQTCLYIFNLLTNTPVRLAQFSAPVVNLLWAPDGSGALVVLADGKLVFVRADGTGVLDLSLAAGQNPRGFVWLPPSLRK